MTLKGPEIECVKKLAERFESGKLLWRERNNWEAIGLTNENCVPVLTLLEEIGAIKEMGRSSAGPFMMFSITAKAVIYAREIESNLAKENEPKDFVDEVKSMARKNKWLAIAIITVTVIVAVITGVNQGISLVKNIRDFSKPTVQP